MSAIKNAVGTIENKMCNLESNLKEKNINMNVKIDELKANQKNQEENQKIIINNL